ncbi:MAG: long-chain fatty acid--CoA ligase [Candidatus Rokubacteria bacterium]|nr:long-chain fatty acid--CoA ligase [Candidatus Rokubacteria bacterium]
MPSPRFNDLVEMFERSVLAYGSRPLFGLRRNEQWTWTTYAEVGRQVDALRGGLAALGIRRGDRVAIVSNNRVEWAVAAYACYGLGAALVPMYEAQLSKEWAFICGDSGAVAIIASTAAIDETCRDIPANVPSVKHVIGLARPESDPASFAALLAAGSRRPVPSIRPAAGDTACLLYTSGTTGNPKGVILSHGNIASNVSAVHEIMPMQDADRSFSFLPWAHSFGQTCELHTLLSLGASMAICEDLTKLVDQLPEVQPTILVSVPRVFNRIYDGVNAQIAAKPGVIQRLFRRGLDVAKRRRAGEPLGVGDRLAFGLADRLIFSKIRARFGGRLRYAFSGGAALAREVAEFVDGLGITVYEGYGLTETSPIATANRPGAHRIGSVGRAIPGVRIAIDRSQTGEEPHGEIVVYGPNVMQGYHNRDDENRAVLTGDGGFRTGDLGYVDDEDFLYITGRIKEQYKLENGKYVAPAPLEETLKLSPYILNAMIYGENRTHNVALIVPDIAAVRRWASREGLTVPTGAELLTDPRVTELIRGEIDRYAEEWKSFEKIRRFVLAPEDFTTENGMLTPTLKLKRRVAWQKHGRDLEALYGEAAPRF